MEGYINKYTRENKYLVTAKEFRQKINNLLYENLPEIGSSLFIRINDNILYQSPLMARTIKTSPPSKEMSIDKPNKHLGFVF